MTAGTELTEIYLRRILNDEYLY